jgi:plasmid stabilization system protein ParE
LLVGAQVIRAQSGPSESEQFKARINEVARSLQDHPRLRRLSQHEREKVVEFITGNILFVALHELAHAAVTELDLAVLGHEEDAADDFAAMQLINVGSDLSHRVLVEAAKGWFYSDRRDRRDGEKLVFYDEHSLDQVRAYNIVCLIVGSSPGKFTDLATEVKLPAERQETCPRDFATASRSWAKALKPHYRPAEQPKTKIEVVYGDAKGELTPYAQGFRVVQLLETVAEHAADGLAWPSPFTLEMQSCGDINARWVDTTRKLTICYELAADFGELYRDFAFASANVKKRRSK